MFIDNWWTETAVLLKKRKKFVSVVQPVEVRHITMTMYTGSSGMNSAKDGATTGQCQGLYY